VQRLCDLQPCNLSAGSNPAACSLLLLPQVPGCDADLMTERMYNQRHKICQKHVAADAIPVPDVRVSCQTQQEEQMQLQRLLLLETLQRCRKLDGRQMAAAEADTSSNGEAAAAGAGGAAAAAAQAVAAAGAAAGAPDIPMTLVRWCQQCGRLEKVVLFDGNKR